MPFRSIKPIKTYKFVHAKFGFPFISMTDPAYVLYLAYVKTPYYKFARDTLSYLLLAGLHFVLCLEPVTREISVLEWIIFTFFIGRYLVERKQMRQQKDTYFRFVCVFFSHHTGPELLKEISIVYDKLTLNCWK